MINSEQTLTVEAGGGTVTYAPNDIPASIYLTPDGGSVSLGAPYTLETSAHPVAGTTVVVSWEDGIDLNGQTLIIFGVSLTQAQLNVAGSYVFNSISASAYSTFYIPYDLTQADTLTGAALRAGTVPLAALASMTATQIIVANSGGVPTAVEMTGDVTISDAGVTSIGAGVIVNADVNASAAIARTKLASGTASHVLINDGSGVMSSEAQLAVSRGGTGINTSASTGFATVAAGTWSVSAISEVITIPVSFETGEQCNNRFKMPFAGTVTEVYAVVTKAIAGTDDATITMKDGAGTTMTDGVFTFTASDPLETAQTVTPTANNTFAAGDILYATAAKTTAGGKVLLSITVTRNS